MVPYTIWYNVNSKMSPNDISKSNRTNPLQKFRYIFCICSSFLSAQHCFFWFASADYILLPCYLPKVFFFETPLIYLLPAFSKILSYFMKVESFLTDSRVGSTYIYAFLGFYGVHVDNLIFQLYIFSK